MIGAYGISKAADFALCRSLAGEWGPQGVRVNCVAPGLVQDRFRPRAVGRRGAPEAPLRHHAAAPHRRARRDRRRRGLSRLRCLDLHDRPDHRGRRRRDHGVGVAAHCRPCEREPGPVAHGIDGRRCSSSALSDESCGLLRRDDSGILTNHTQSACLAPNHNTPGRRRQDPQHVLRPGHRSGHHLVARHRVPQRHLDRRDARSRNSRSISRRPAGSSTSRRTSGPRRWRPAATRWRRPGSKAKDIAAIGITNQRETTVVWDRATGKADPPRHRLAGPPHLRHLRQTEERRPRAGDHGEDRPDHRPLFLRHQGRLDPRPRARRARTRRARRTAVRHRRLLSAVAADRRQGARHRRHQRLAHAAVQHPHRRVGRRTAETAARAALDAARGEGLLRRFRRDRAGPVRRRHRRSRASPATSRPPPSARPASRPA